MKMVKVSTQPTLQIGKPELLFEGPYQIGSAGDSHANYDVTADGKRFLMTVDTGALIAFERNDRRVAGIIERALTHRVRLAVPAGVVGQSWRDGRREGEILDDRRARTAGQLCRKAIDVIDASVVLCARIRNIGSGLCI